MIFQVSRQADYAIQLVRRLAQLAPDTRISLSEFSRESSISFLFLQKIARRLKQAKIIDSTRGAHGGYFLVREAASLNLKEVVEAVEGTFGLVDCVRTPGSCGKVHTCSTKSIWEKMNQEVLTMLATTPIL